MQTVDPTALEHEVPPAFVWTNRREPHAGISFDAAPDSQFQKLLPLNISWQEAPDPIRQSDFWASGNKIKPDARMRIVSHLAIGSREAVMENAFRVGKLMGYLQTPTYVGGQQASTPRTNIVEAQQTTLGSLYETMPVPGDQTPYYTSAGFDFSYIDGYPY